MTCDANAELTVQAAATTGTSGSQSAENGAGPAKAARSGGGLSIAARAFASLGEAARKAARDGVSRAAGISADLASAIAPSCRLPCIM